MLAQVCILSLFLGGIIGFLVGGFLEWDAAQETIKALKSDIRASYRENDQLLEHIQSLRNPSVRR